MKAEKAKEEVVNNVAGNFLQQYLEHPDWLGVEEEVQMLEETEEGPRAAEKPAQKETMEKLADIEGFNSKTEEVSDVPIEVEDQRGEELNNIWTFDIASNEVEMVTRPLNDLEDIHNEREHLYEVMKNKIPEDHSLYMVGLAPGMMDDAHAEEVDSFYAVEKLEDGDTPNPEEMMVDKFRYDQHLLVHKASEGEDQVLRIGTTTSTQVNMQPDLDPYLGDFDEEELQNTIREYEERGEVDKEVKEKMDDFIADFQGKLGMDKLSALFYAPFQCSPRFDEGKLDKHNKRNDQYTEGFKESSKADLSENQKANVDNQKWGILPELDQVRGLDEYIQGIGENNQIQFTDTADPEDVYVEGKNLTEEEYDLKEEHLEDGVKVVVSPEVDTDYFEFVEQEGYQGIAHFKDANGEEQTVDVEVEIEDFDESDAYANWIGHESGVWQSYRMRADTGVFESRDYGSSPRNREAIDTQVAVMNKWHELQDYVEDLGVEKLSVEEAREMKKGFENEGMSYQPFEKAQPGMTGKEFWMGTEEMNYGAIDILQEGVAESSTKEYAEKWRDRMEDHVKKTASQEMYEEAQQKGFIAALESTKPRCKVKELLASDD